VLSTFINFNRIYQFWVQKFQSVFGSYYLFSLHINSINWLALRIRLQVCISFLRLRVSTQKISKQNYYYYYYYYYYYRYRCCLLSQAFFLVLPLNQRRPPTTQASSFTIIIIVIIIWKTSEVAPCYSFTNIEGGWRRKVVEPTIRFQYSVMQYALQRRHHWILLSCGRILPVLLTDFYSVKWATVCTDFLCDCEECGAVMNTPNLAQRWKRYCIVGRCF
jgi:hypothetical protein